jgi:hypothetical protein
VLVYCVSIYIYIPRKNAKIVYASKYNEIAPLDWNAVNVIITNVTVWFPSEIEEEIHVYGTRSLFIISLYNFFLVVGVLRWEIFAEYWFYFSIIICG